MTITSSLQRELIFLAISMLVLLIVGSMFDVSLQAVFSGLMVYLFWHLYNLNRLIQWLAKPKKNTPESMGIWDEVFFQLYYQYKRYTSSRRKITKMLKQFQKTSKAMPYATIALNSNYEIEWFNPASKILFGLRSGLDIGQRIDNLIRQPVFINYLYKKKFNTPLEFENQGQTLIINITRFGKEQYLLSARDVTQRIQLDEMRRDFISNASHELRTPLTVMAGYIEMLQNSVDDANKYPVDKIQQQTVRMEKIIAELIELAKLETSMSADLNSEVDTDSLLNDVYNEAVSLDLSSHKIELDIDPIRVHGNYSEIRTAVSNLLTNAIRYTPDGSSIMLSTSTDELGSYIHVKDNGIGISYEHVPRLTERFYRVDEGRSREKGGTGLGLAIVKQILDRHGANLEIKSELNKGSTFSCYFPKM